MRQEGAERGVARSRLWSERGATRRRGKGCGKKALHGGAARRRCMGMRQEGVAWGCGKKAWHGGAARKRGMGMRRGMGCDKKALHGGAAIRRGMGMRQEGVARG